MKAALDFNTYNLPYMRGGDYKTLSPRRISNSDLFSVITREKPTIFCIYVASKHAQTPDWSAFDSKSDQSGA